MAATDPRRRFPVVLTLFTAVAFAILCGFGVWQVQRMQWKRDLLARIEAAQARPPAPLGEVLALAAKGEAIEFRRVTVDCAAAGLPPSKVMLFGLNQGRPAWRPIAPCVIDTAGYGVIAIDRGFLPGETPKPRVVTMANPVRVTGVLRRPTAGPRDHPGNVVERGIVTYAEDDDAGYFDREYVMARIADLAQRRAPDYMLVAESEMPPPPGVTPAPLPTNISNRHLEYVITWFGLAGALAAIYAAMLFKRLKR